MTLDDIEAVDAKVSTTEPLDAASKGKDWTSTLKPLLKSRRRVEGPVRLLSLGMCTPKELSVP